MEGFIKEAGEILFIAAKIFICGGVMYALLKFASPKELNNEKQDDPE